MQSQTLPGEQPVVIPGLPGVAWRAFQLFSVLAVLSLAIFVAGHFYGRQLTKTGHSSNPAPLEIVVGNDVFAIPENMIRTLDQRIGGVSKRIDLQVHWPTRSGFTADLAPQFNSVDAQTVQLVMMAITERTSLLDMNARFEPVYVKAFVPGSQKVLSYGLYSAKLSGEYGFVDEVLYYSRPTETGEPVFTARCQEPAPGSEQLLLACVTDVFTGNTSEIRIRFPRHMLAEWKEFAVQLPRFIEALQVR